MADIDILELVEDAPVEETKFDDLTFKEGMGLLEDIVRMLESGDLELEQSLKVYALGVALLSELQGRLTSAEQEVEVLMGKLEAAPDDDVQDTTLLNA